MPKKCNTFDLPYFWLVKTPNLFDEYQNCETRES